MEILIKLPANSFIRKNRLKSTFNTWLKKRDVGKYLLHKGEDGGDDLANFNHNVAVHIIPNLMIKAGIYDGDGVELIAPVFDGSHLMVKFVSSKAKTAFIKQRTKEAVINRDGKEVSTAQYSLPVGFSVIKNPRTMVWL